MSSNIVASAPATEERVLDATVAMLRELSYSELSMRTVAARAGVSPATAYSYFPSKNALIAATYLHLVRKVPYFTNVNESTGQRVVAQLQAMALLVADEPEMAAATTTAILGDEPVVQQIREQIGSEVHRRIAAALGPDAGPDELKTLELVFYGALVRAGARGATYYQIADKLDGVVALITKGAQH